MAEDLSSAQGQGACHFGKDPIEANHDSDFDSADFEDLQSLIARMEELLLTVEKVQLSILSDKALRPDNNGRVIDAVASDFRQAHHQNRALLCGKRVQPSDARATRYLFCIPPQFGCIGELIAGQGKFRQHPQIRLMPFEQFLNLPAVSLDFPKAGSGLQESNTRIAILIL